MRVNLFVGNKLTEDEQLFWRNRIWSECEELAQKLALATLDAEYADRHRPIDNAYSFVYDREVDLDKRLCERIQVWNDVFMKHRMLSHITVYMFII